MYHTDQHCPAQSETMVRVWVWISRMRDKVKLMAMGMNVMNTGFMLVKVEVWAFAPQADKNIRPEHHDHDSDNQL
jgi:hypothetical protein